METTPASSTTTRTGRRSSATGFVRRLTLTAVFLFVILAVVVSVAWLVLDPDEPGFRVSSLSVSNFTVSDSQFRGKYEMELTVRNPNKKIKVVLDDFVVFVYYGLVGLSRAAVQPPMYLDKMSDENLKVELLVRESAKLVHKVGSEDLVKDWNRGVVNFNVKLLVRARFSAGIWPSREKILDVYCGDLDVGFFSAKDTGKLLGIGKDCLCK